MNFWKSKNKNKNKSKSKNKNNRENKSEGFISFLFVVTFSLNRMFRRKDSVIEPPSAKANKMSIAACKHTTVYEERINESNERISWALDHLETEDEIQPQRVLGARFCFNVSYQHHISFSNNYP